MKNTATPSGKKIVAASIPPETDTIPRINLADLFLSLRVFERESGATLEDIRLRLCVDRGKKLAGDLYWATATAIIAELHRLNLVDGGSVPKDRRSYERVCRNKLTLTTTGMQLAETFRADRAKAYDDLFRTMYRAHRYLRAFIKAILKKVLLAPVITSVKEHLSERYTSAVLLAEDVSRRKLDSESLIKSLETRLKRTLTEAEIGEIYESIATLLEDTGLSAISDEATEFAKKFVLKLNDVIFPAVFRSEDLAFDYKTHASIWSLGQEWKLWQASSRHPDFDARLIYSTATITIDSSQDEIAELTFDRGLQVVGQDFLRKVYNAYQFLQKHGRGTYALVWELRAVFCYEHRCQESVFDRLMEDHYVGSDEFELHMEIQRQKSQYDRPLRVGSRNIGLIRVLKKGA